MFRAAIVLLMLAATPAIAEDAAKRTIDMTHVMLDEQGKPAPDIMFKEPVSPGTPDPDPACSKCPRLTLGHAIAHALFATFPQNPATPDQKWARAVLAERIKDDPHAALTAEEVTVIKKQMGEAYGGILLVQAFPMIDPNAKVPDIK